MSNLTYFEFEDKSNDHQQQSQGAGGKLLQSLLTRIIPTANPDYDGLIHKVHFWRIEFDLSENLAQREIGFDKNHEIIMTMPTEENYGYWTDNHLTLEDFEKFNPWNITQEEFEKDWNKFEQSTQ